MRKAITHLSLYESRLLMSSGFEQKAQADYTLLHLQVGGYAMRFGEKLRALRKEKGLTQAELAKLAGVGLKTITNYE